MCQPLGHEHGGNYFKLKTMNTDKINEKLMDLSKKEIRDVTTDFFCLLNRKYPDMYRRYKDTELDKDDFFAFVRNSKGDYVPISIDKLTFRNGSDIKTLQSLIRKLLEGVYLDNLHTHKVDELIKKLDVFE